MLVRLIAVLDLGDLDRFAVCAVDKEAKVGHCLLSECCAVALATVCNVGQCALSVQSFVPIDWRELIGGIVGERLTGFWLIRMLVIFQRRQDFRGHRMDATEAVPVVRDSKGRLAKGSAALNPGGYSAREARMLRDLRALGPRAIAKLGTLLEDPNGSVALGAAKEILDRTLGKVRQNVQVDVTSTHVLHLQALEELAARKRAQLIEAQATEIAGNATLHIEGLRGRDVVEAGLIEPGGTSEAAEPPGTPQGAGAAADAPPSPSTHQK